MNNLTPERIEKAKLQMKEFSQCAYKPTKENAKTALAALVAVERVRKYCKCMKKIATIAEKEEIVAEMDCMLVILEGEEDDE